MGIDFRSMVFGILLSWCLGIDFCHVTLFQSFLIRSLLQPPLFVDTQMYIKITNDASPNPTHGEVHWIQHYVIKFVSDLQQVCGFLHVLWF